MLSSLTESAATAASLALIFGAATGLALAGLSLAMSFTALSRVREHTTPDLHAVERACEDSPLAGAYRAAVAAQERELTVIEATAMLRAAGLGYQLDNREVPRLVRFKPLVLPEK